MWPNASHRISQHLQQIELTDPIAFVGAAEEAEVYNSDDEADEVQAHLTRPASPPLVIIRRSVNLNIVYFPPPHIT